MTTQLYRIGDITSLTSLTADTLRYYEKIKLLPRVARTEGGIRQYDDKDLSRLRFIQRAQKMDFSLAEISKLLNLCRGSTDGCPIIEEMDISKTEK